MPNVTTLDVDGTLRFTFGSRWSAFIWDECDERQRGLGSHRGTQAVDILAVLDQREVWLIEVKDPRGHRIQFRDKAENIHSVVADKARDTLASAIWSTDRIKSGRVESALRKVFPKNAEPVGVLLWMEGLDAAAASAAMTKIRSRLKWLNPKVFATSRALFATSPVLEDLAVVSLQGAQPRP